MHHLLAGLNLLALILGYALIGLTVISMLLIWIMTIRARLKLDRKVQLMNQRGFIFGSPQPGYIKTLKEAGQALGTEFCRDPSRKPYVLRMHSHYSHNSVVRLMDQANCLGEVKTQGETVRHVVKAVRELIEKAELSELVLAAPTILDPAN
jgi:hypothetical protein